MCTLIPTISHDLPSTQKAPKERAERPQLKGALLHVARMRRSDTFFAASLHLWH